MLTYSLYGFSLKSDWVLPCPVHGDTALGEVCLREATPQRFQEKRPPIDQEFPSSKLYHYVQLNDGWTYLCWPTLFEFLISPDGREILGNPLSKNSPEAFNTYLLGHVLSFAMLHQKIEHFHCSAVVVDGVAICFLGNCGYGKSTLAASFLKAGHRLLSDDILVFRPGAENHLYAYPGPSRIKLFPAISRVVLGYDREAVPMNHMTPKLIIPLDESQVCQQPVLARAIYALSPPSPRTRSGKVVIRRLSEKRALVKVIEGTFNNYVTDPERLRNQFFASREVASKLSVKGIYYPRTFDALWAARDGILADLARSA